MPNVTVRINWGPPGQHTPHLHVHAVPRRPDDGHDGYMPGPLFPVTAAEAAAFVRTLGRSPYLRQSALTAESLPPLARPLQIRDFAIDTLEPGHPMMTVEPDVDATTFTEQVAWFASALRTISLAVPTEAQGDVGHWRDHSSVRRRFS